MFASSLESCQSKLNIFTNKKIKFPLLFQVRQHSSSTFPRHSPVLSTEIVSSQRANLSDWHQVFVSGWLEIRSLQGVTAIDESLRLHIENINRLLSLSLSHALLGRAERNVVALTQLWHLALSSRHSACWCSMRTKQAKPGQLEGSQWLEPLNFLRIWFVKLPLLLSVSPNSNLFKSEKQLKLQFYIITSKVGSGSGMLCLCATSYNLDDTRNSQLS